MRRSLVVMGAGGFARETVELVNAINAVEPTWDLLGLLDDDERTHGTTRVGVPVLGASDWLDARRDVAVVVCLGSPTSLGLRERVVDRLALDDDRYATLVHPSAVVPASVTVGPGTVIHAGSVATAEIEIGAHVAVMPAVVFTHDDVVADFATFGAGVRLAGGVAIGRGAYVGSGACVRENLTIGAEALIGMGSVVVRDVPAGETWWGSPARRHTAE